MATLIAVANQKGGPGKTTTTINLAGVLASTGRRIATYDTDKQSTLWKFGERRAKLPLNGFSVEHVAQGMLEDKLAELRLRDDIDIALLDCPPEMGEVMQQVIENADAVVTPLSATYFDLDATHALVKLVGRAQLAHPEKKLMIFLNKYKASRAIDRGAREELVRIFGSKPNTSILKSYISDTAPLAEFGGSGKTITEYAPKSTAALQYKKLTKEIVECLLATA